MTLTFDLLTLNFQGISGVMRLNYVRNRIIHGWDIDDLARFRVQFKGVGHNWQSCLGVREPNFTKIGQDMGDHNSIALLFQNLNILLHFETRKLKVERCWKRRQISHYLTALWQ